MGSACLIRKIVVNYVPVNAETSFERFCLGLVEA